MATRPELNEAVAGTPNKASEYNENFELMMDFVDDSVEEMETSVTSKADLTLSNITSLSSAFKTLLLNALYPVGAIYASITNTATCPMQTALGGTWTLVSSGKALWTGNGSNANTTIAAGLPNITGNVTNCGWSDRCTGFTGVFSSPSTVEGARFSSELADHKRVEFSATKSNSIFGNSSTVQPPAYVVNVWKRTA